MDAGEFRRKSACGYGLGGGSDGKGFRGKQAQIVNDFQCFINAYAGGVRRMKKEKRTRCEHLGPLSA